VKDHSVLVVGNYASAWGGAAGACESLAAQLRGQGWEVTATSRVRPRLRRLVDMVGTTWRRRASYRVASVDVYSGAAFVWVAVVCLVLILLRKPYVLALHGGGLPEFVSRRGRTVGFFARRSKAIVAQSGYLAACLPQHQDKISIIPNGLDVARYPFRLREAPKPLLIWVRSFHKIYNPALAIETLALLIGDFPGANLAMVGPDKGDGSLADTRAVASALGVAERVRFVGGVPKADIPAWLDEADILLNTTDFDNMPVSVEEAMACGLCVVSTEVGGLRYLLDDGENALLVPPRDATAMAESVRRILTEDGLAARLSTRARAKIEAFDWSTVILAWEKVLLTAAGAGSGPGGAP